MKIGKKLIPILSVLLLLFFFLSSTVVVPEDASVCIKRFNKVISIHEDAGLIYKIPFIDSTTYMPKNIMNFDLNPSDVLTMDKKAMTVSSYCVWKIDEPLKFLQTVGNINEAERRLDAAVYNVIKNLLSSMNQTEILSERGNTLDTKITESVKEQMSYYGINIVDVQIKQNDLPEDNKQAVYARMISERSQIAAQYTAEGKEEATIIRNTTDKEKSLLISEAKAKAEQYKGEGEREYMKILAEAYQGTDRAEFYEFIRALDALQLTMKGDKTIILPMDSPLTKWFLNNK